MIIGDYLMIAELSAGRCKPIAKSTLMAASMHSHARVGDGTRVAPPALIFPVVKERDSVS